MTNALGPDCSFWQDDNETPQGINFNQMRQAGASFVILRAGQGNHVDPDFQSNWLAAKAAGLPRGTYWFYDSRYTPSSQAALFTSLIGNDLPELYAWLDLEEAYGGTYQGWQNWRLCLEALRMSLPHVGIYTGWYYWMEHRPTGSEALSFFKSFPLWIANYGVSTPLIPSPWTNWLFWQFTSQGDGLFYGVESKEIDLNYFNGNETYFRNYFDLGALPPSTETGEITMALYEGTAKLTATPNVRIRKPNPDGSLNELGTTIDGILPGQAFKADRKSPDSQGRGDWLHVTDKAGKPEDGWSAGWLLDYHETVITPPASEEYILYVLNGVTKKFVPE
jgi:lysozyme